MATSATAGAAYSFALASGGSAGTVFTTNLGVGGHFTQGWKAVYMFRTDANVADYNAVLGFATNGQMDISHTNNNTFGLRGDSASVTLTESPQNRVQADVPTTSSRRFLRLRYQLSAP